MPCEFCSELNISDTHQRWWIQNDIWAIGPTVGHFTPGYLLMVPIDHYLSLSSMPADNLIEADIYIKRIRNVLNHRYGPTIIAEHGSGGHCKRGSSCCDHAHLHAIPLKNSEMATSVKNSYLTADSNVIRLKSFDELVKFKDTPYLYLSIEAGEHLVWILSEHNQDRFPRQFIRRVCSSALNCPNWDWRKSPYYDQMLATRNTLAPDFSSPPYLKEA